jgi:hypothetical protein
MEEFIDAQEPGRFSKATLKSTAQNINSSWTQSGHLTGRVRKVRPVRWRRQARSPWPCFWATSAVCAASRCSRATTPECSTVHSKRTIELAEDASRRGWISLKRVGQVVEVLFPNLITAQEMEWLREQN